MLEVDVEANDIILIEPLTPQLAAVNHSESRRDRRRRRRSIEYENLDVIKHASGGAMALVFLLAVVFFNRQSLVQCDGNDSVFVDGSGANVTIIDSTVGCNITTI